MALAWVLFQDIFNPTNGTPAGWAATTIETTPAAPATTDVAPKAIHAALLPGWTNVQVRVSNTPDSTTPATTLVKFGPLVFRILYGTTGYYTGKINLTTLTRIEFNKTPTNNDPTQKFKIELLVDLDPGDTTPNNYNGDTAGWVHFQDVFDPDPPTPLPDGWDNNKATASTLFTVKPQYELLHPFWTQVPLRSRTHQLQADYTGFRMNRSQEHSDELIFNPGDPTYYHVTAVPLHLITYLQLFYDAPTAPPMSLELELKLDLAPTAAQWYPIQDLYDLAELGHNLTPDRWNSPILEHREENGYYFDGPLTPKPAHAGLVLPPVTPIRMIRQPVEPYPTSTPSPRIIITPTFDVSYGYYDDPTVSGIVTQGAINSVGWHGGSDPLRFTIELLIDLSNPNAALPFWGDHQGTREHPVSQ